MDNKIKPKVAAPVEYHKELKKLQLYGSTYKEKRYAELSKTTLNSYQNFLYNRALFGLTVYDKEEVKQMHWEKRKRILKVQRRTQSILNLWKQSIVNKKVTNMFTNLFPNSSLTAGFKDTMDYTDPGYINKMPFKTLGVRREVVINKLISEGILPKNFYELKPEIK